MFSLMILWRFLRRPSSDDSRKAVATIFLRRSVLSNADASKEISQF